LLWGFCVVAFKLVVFHDRTVCLAAATSSSQKRSYEKTFSPYDNLEKRAHPAILVATSFNDGN